MNVRELKDILADADDEYDVVANGLIVGAAEVDEDDFAVVLVPE